jgi:glycosyltransferase involved in cell wall biosynthesis
MKKIIIAYFLISEVRAGVEEHVLDLMSRLDPQRFEISLICTPKLAVALENDLKTLPVRVHEIKIQGWTDLNSINKLYLLFRSEKFDIVHSHMFKSSFFCTPIARLARIPVIVETDHGREGWRKGFIKGSYFIDRLIARLTTRIIAVSEACGEYLLNEKKISPKKIVVIQNGRDLSIYNPETSIEVNLLKQELGIENGRIVFGVVGRLEEQKGHTYLLEAISEVLKESQKLKVLIVGDGSLREQLEAKADRLGIRDYLIFTGFRDDVPRLLQLMDVVVLPSLYEGLPLVAIEASAMGKPVIATAVDGTPEVILDGETGILVGPRDPSSLARAMLSLLLDSSRRTILGKKGRDFVNQKFSIRRQIEETEKLYYSCVKGSDRC